MIRTISCFQNNCLHECYKERKQIGKMLNIQLCVEEENENKNLPEYITEFFK